MAKRILGVDVDGVLADFNAAFIDLVIHVTGRDLFPPRPFDIPTWDYPQFYGYTDEELGKVWNAIEESPIFWQTLPPYADTSEAARYLRDRISEGDDVYFVTSRPGASAKTQTERWLRRLQLAPTVLISSAKGLVSKALKLDAYIDDRWENAVDTATAGTRTALMVRPWNRRLQDRNTTPADFGIYEVDSVVGFVERVM